MKNTFTIKAFDKKNANYIIVASKISLGVEMFEVYEMSSLPNSPQGVNIYLGDLTKSEVKQASKGYKQINFSSLSDEVINAIFNRCKIVNY
jgi:hypothetical protein